MATGDINDLSLQRLQKMIDEQGGSGGFAFLGENTAADDEDMDTYLRRRKDNINKYKQSMLQEYEDEMRRKQQNHLFRAAKKGGVKLPDNNTDEALPTHVPKSLGKADPALNRMSSEEVKDIHVRHKRQYQESEIKKKEEFEVNQEEEDDDFAGPTLDLFLNDDRKRKDNGILKKVMDVDDDDNDSQQVTTVLPISHEVVLSGHEKSLQTIDIDRHGNRMISGGLDYLLKIWDFPGMNRKLNSMR